MAERFLILGASSFYGSNFAKLVREKGDEAICLSRPEFDLDKNLSPLHEALEIHFPDYIVNFISRSLVEESWEEPDVWMHTNATMTGLMFYALRGRKFKKFIHVSTPEVYGSTPGWIDESFEYWEPSTPYAVSRAAGDMMLRAYHKAYGFPGVITRTANIYGPGQPAYRLIPNAFDCKARGVPIPLHGSGTSSRCFIHVRDSCEATYLIAKRGSVGETYHISTYEPHTIRNVVELIGCRWEPAPERLGKDRAYLLDSTKLRRLGWKDTITLEEGLCELSRLE